MNGTLVNVLTQQFLREIAKYNIDDALDLLKRAKLCMYISSQLDCPDQLRAALETNYPKKQYQESRSRLKKESQRISKMLNADGLQHAFFKGASLLAVAPEYTREMADLDLWLWRTEDLFQCWACLNTLGYRCDVNSQGCWLINSPEPACQMGFVSADNEIYIDVHIGKCLSFLSPSLKLDTRPIPIDGVACLPLEECALLTLAHCAIERQVMPRDFLDLAAFIDRGASIDKLKHLAQSNGLQKIFEICIQSLHNGFQNEALQSTRVHLSWHQRYRLALWHFIDIHLGHLLLNILGHDLWYLEAAVEHGVKTEKKIWKPYPNFGCNIHKLGKVAIFARDRYALVGLNGLNLGAKETDLYDDVTIDSGRTHESAPLN